MSETSPQMTDSDDDFHFGKDAGWWEAESLWFAFDVPDKKLDVIVYLVTRPGMGHSSLFISIFDPSGFEPWKLRYNRILWAVPIPASLRKFDMPEVGLSFETVEATNSYRIRYRHDPHVSFDVTFTGLMTPHMTPGKYGGMHIDQPGRVRGELVLDGERLQVDCLQMRDRSWGSTRSDLEERRGGYTYGVASETSAFHLISARGESGTIDMRIGFLVRDGVLSPLRTGVREVVRRGAHGQPAEVLIRGEDELGRTFTARGEVESFAFLQVPGNIFGMACLTRWDFDGQTCWGEEQESWSPLELSAYLRS